MTITLKTVSLTVLLAAAIAAAQTIPSAPVSYSSVSQLNMMLSELDQASQSTQADLARVRIDKWKTDSSNKQQVQADVQSIQRNLQYALPEMMTQLRNSPENLADTFKLYRNLDALYDVFGAVVESAGAFGSKDDFRALQNDLSKLQASRKSFADRMENLSSSKEAELGRLRSQLQTALAAAPQPPPKKVIVDDTEPKKAPLKKKSKAKAGTTTKPSTSTSQPPKPQ